MRELFELLFCPVHGLPAYAVACWPMLQNFCSICLTMFDKVRHWKPIGR